MDLFYENKTKNKENWFVVGLGIVWTKKATKLTTKKQAEKETEQTKFIYGLATNTWNLTSCCHIEIWIFGWIYFNRYFKPNTGLMEIYVEKKKYIHLIRFEEWIFQLYDTLVFFM